MRRVVIQRADDDAVCVGHDARGIAAPGVVQVAHLAGVAAREPFVEVRGIGEFRGCGDAAEIEADGDGLLDDPIGVRRGWHLADDCARARTRRKAVAGICAASRDP